MSLNDSFYESIDLYAYGDCSEEELNEFKKHLKTCEKCKKEYNLALSLKQAMSSMPKITPPADFSELLNKRLDNEKKKTRFSAYRKYSAAAACLVLVSALGVDMVKLTDPSPTENYYPSFTEMPDSTVTELPNNEEQLESEIDISENTAPTAIQTETDAVAHASTAAAKKTVSHSEDNLVKPSSKPTSEPTSEPTSKPVVKPKQNNEQIEPEVYVSNEDFEYEKNNIPSYMDPREHVVLASTVEKEYKTSGVKLEDVPVKERDLQAEFSLLENPKTGNIIANQATLASLEGVRFESQKRSPDVQEYGIGSGSIFISSKDRSVVNELLEKYKSTENNSVYYITGENFKTFTDELNSSGVSYKEHLIPQNGENVMFKIIES